MGQIDRFFTSWGGFGPIWAETTPQIGTAGVNGYTQAAMDRLWTPWRYNYVSRADRQQRKGVPAALDAWEGDFGCVFCNMIAAVNHAVETGMSREAAEKAAYI